MNLELIAFIGGLMLVPFSYLFFQSIFLNKKYNLPIFAIVLILALVGFLKVINNAGGRLSLYVFLLCPLYSLLLLKAALYVFRYNFDRYPKKPEPYGLDFGWDEIFNGIYLIMSLALPIFLLRYAN